MDGRLPGPPVDSPDSRAALAYVAGYVSGVAFSDRRILSDNGQEIELYMWLGAFG